MSAADRSVALVTPSFSGDVERARLLCETIDARVSNVSHHYILVDPLDVDLFRSFEGPRRTVVDERDILPLRFRIVRMRGRRLWLAWSRGFRALRGWHVQQLRRIAIAHHVSEPALLYCDSDMAFVRAFDTADLWQDHRLRLYRVPGGIHDALPDAHRDHLQWTRWAHRLNGLSPPAFPAPDYINNLVSWRTDHVRSMCREVEDRFGTDWASAVSRQRSFSECQIYGAYVSEVRRTVGHWATERPLCRTYWSGSSLDEESLREFIAQADADQVAVGIQSFTRTDIGLIRDVVAP